jgi:hypothetical protein
MNTRHREVLADLESQIVAAGTAMDQVDARIAAALGVPADYYFAYLLVGGALEEFRRDGPAVPPGSDDDDPGEVVRRCRQAAEAASTLVSGIYEQACQATACVGVADHAAQALGALIRVRRALPDVPVADPDLAVS